MRKLILLLIIISLSIYFVTTNFAEIKYHLPLSVKEETKTNLVETKKMLQGDPMKVARWLDNNVIGKSDGCVQYAQTAEETFERGSGDCMEENTYILIKNGIKKIKDIQIGDLVLSYNYDKEKYEYKPVTNKWNKGVLSGNFVKLRNGHFFIATDDHRFFVRELQKDKKIYSIKRLKDIDITRWWKRQIHCVYKIPSGMIKIDKDKAYIYGIYLAEGWYSYHKLEIAQDKLDIQTKIEYSLDELKIPYSKSKRLKSQSYIIKKSWLKEELKRLGTNSFDKRIPLEILNWDKESIQAFLEGLIDGDGTNRKNILGDSSLWEFSTSSEQVAYMFNILVRKVWGNCWFFKQEYHQGVGNKPIYRLRFNPKGLSNQEIFPNLSTVSIKKIKKVEGLHYYDIEVKDNHNFVLAKNGVISHNCEDYSILAKYFLGARYNEIHLVVWEGKFKPFSKYYKKHKH